MVVTPAVSMDRFIVQKKGEESARFSVLSLFVEFMSLGAREFLDNYPTSLVLHV